MELSLEALAAYLDTCLESARFPDDQHGIYRPSTRPIERLGLALEPWPGMWEWIQENDLHALFLHRPWRVRADEIPAELGILSYHLAFDWQLTFGFNPRLATALGMKNLLPFGWRDTFAQGMCGDIDATSLATLACSLTQIFGTTPSLKLTCDIPVKRVAVVGALNAQLVYAAAEQGVQLYLTGEWRPSALQALRATGINVMVIGHVAGERWGLRTLGYLLCERWSKLEVRVFA